ncbi:hypothetical protein LIA77_06969 [Sarocladium implicatum]|nr:hypothetical protein LIA77_06969 [Sarocladium implicatum]
MGHEGDDVFTHNHPSAARISLLAHVTTTRQRFEQSIGSKHNTTIVKLITQGIPSLLLTALPVVTSPASEHQTAQPPNTNRRLAPKHHSLSSSNRQLQPT